MTQPLSLGLRDDAIYYYMHCVLKVISLAYGVACLSALGSLWHGVYSGSHWQHSGHLRRSEVSQRVHCFYVI